MLKRILAGLIVAVVMAFAAFGEVHAEEARYRLDAANERVVELSNLSPGGAPCQPARFQGFVAKLNFDTEGLVPTSVTIKEVTGERTLVNVDTNALDGDSRVVWGWVVQGLQTLLREGHRVSLGVKLCGAAGRVVMLDSVIAGGAVAAGLPMDMNRYCQDNFGPASRATALDAHDASSWRCKNGARLAGVSLLRLCHQQYGSDYGYTLGDRRDASSWSCVPSQAGETLQAAQPPLASAPSFDCRTASLPTEFTICGDSDLASFDAEMANEYLALISATSAGSMRQIVGEQSRWLKTRNACQTDRQCIASVYRERLQRFSEWRGQLGVVANSLGTRGTDYGETVWQPPPSEAPAPPAGPPPQPAPTSSQPTVVETPAYGGGATIKVEKTTDKNGREVTFISVDGELVAGDEKRFANAAVRATGGTMVVLNSPGGNMLAGIKIGKDIRLEGFDTAVPQGLQCASACAFAWLGGTRRFMADSATVGFHAVYTTDNGQNNVSSAGNAVVGGYLSQLGLSMQAIAYIATAQPNDIKWLTFDDAAQLGIEVSKLPPG